LPIGRTETPTGKFNLIFIFCAGEVKEANKKRRINAIPFFISNNLGYSDEQ
jgi:hypothetical protein